MPDRTEMLRAYLNSSRFRELTELDDNKINEVNFSSNSSDPLVEALKKLVFSYCQRDAQVTVIRNVNRDIDKNC